MRIERLGVRLLLLILVAAPEVLAQAPRGAAAPRTTAAITAADLRTRLFLIADDSMGGREPGSTGNFKAAEYIASEFKRLGLRAGW